MKIGIFDSGVGGLIVARAIRRAMPKYDYVYLGDTKRVPYGTRSHETVYEFTKEGIEHLFKKENCAIVIVACNTASARALREIQQKYLPKHFPDRKVLGVLVPTAEECAKYKRVGIIGTTGTIISNTFPIEIAKMNLLLFCGSHSNLNVVNEPNIAYAAKSTNSFSRKKTIVFQNPAPMLVPLAEEGERVLAKPFLIKYLKPLLAQKPEAIALGCTHYPFFKSEIRKIVGKNVKILSQDEIIPKKLKSYFVRHPEIVKKLSKGHTEKILVTDMTKNVQKLAGEWFGKNAKPRLIRL